MEVEAEITRSFLDWNCDAVCYWLSNLCLSNDYSDLFKDRLITGSTLVSLNREQLEKVGVIHDADRLTILQQITSMRADLVTSGMAPHMKRSTPKRRQFVETRLSSRHSGGVRRTSLGRWSPRDDSRGISYPNTEHTSNPMAKYVNVSIQEGSPRTPDSATSINNSPSCFSVDQTSSDSRDSSRMSSPDKLQYNESATASHDGGIVGNSDVNHFSKLQNISTLRYHNVKSLSRTMDRLFQDGEDIFSVYQKAMQAEDSYEHHSGGRLVEILREENTSLKQELETYYQRVRRLQKIEQEVEHIREAHRFMEAGAARREGLEKALRAKLEQEVCRLKEESIGLRAEISSARKESNERTSTEKEMPRKREIRRRDTMITRLIQQNKDAALAREKLEKDLQVARAQLQLQSQENKRTCDTNRESGTSSNTSNNVESDNKIAAVYFESIEKLRRVLEGMQNMSQKREKLEKKLHTQLEAEICRLKKEVSGSVLVGNKEIDFAGSLAEMQIHNTSLKADAVKWEQKCLELAAEKQMSFDAAIIPKNARIASLERSLAEKIDMLHEVQQQKRVYISQLTESKRWMSELNIRLTSARSSLLEKDSVIQMMQKSFLEPEDEGPSIQNCRASPKCPDTPPCQTSEVPSSSSPLPSSVQSPETNAQYSTTSSTPRNAVRPSSLTLTLHHSSNLPGQPVSVKSLGSNGPRQRGVMNGFISREQPSPNKWNSHAHTPCSGGRYSSASSSHHHSGNILSSSAPNSPRVRNTPHKSRITHTNLRLAQVPGTTDRSDSTYRQNHMYANPNVGPSGARRSNYQRPPSPRLVKSKTPPPNYHLVSSGRTNSGSPKMPPKKQRHKSVDNILEKGSSENTFHNGRSAMQDQSYRLFRSLVGDTVSPSQGGGGVSERCGFISSVQVGMKEEASNCQDHHQHTNSSPSNNFIITSS